MPNPSELEFDPITADWTYIRWLGDRREVEAQTMTWDKVVVDRSAELSGLGRFLLPDHEARRADLRLREQSLSGPRPRDDCEVSGTLGSEWFWENIHTRADQATATDAISTSRLIRTNYHPVIT
jgi:hypothetical protein